MANQKSQPITILVDKIMFFKLIDSLRDRFWGIMAINILLLMSVLCFSINPQLLDVSTALSDFGGDIQTSPYFALGMFGSAFSLWRWRKFIVMSTNSKGIVYFLLTTTILGLYLIALFPVTLEPPISSVHNFGVVLLGSSVLLLILVDQYKSFYKKAHRRGGLIRLIRIISMLVMIVGSTITALSNRSISVLDLALIGELLMIIGFAIWVYLKTYLGDNKHPAIKKLAKKSVTIKKNTI